MNEMSMHTWLRDTARDRIGRDYIFEKFEAKKTAVVVVDMQNYFMKEGFQAAAPMAIETVPANNRLAEAVREQGGLIVWIQTTASPEATAGWGIYHEMNGDEKWERRNLELGEDHEGFELWPELDVRDGDLMIKKTRYSAFVQGSSPIHEELSARGIDTLLVTGVATGVCCESTARDAMMLNYRVTMVSDTLASFTAESHENALKAIFGRFGDVQTVDEVIAHLTVE